MSGELTVEPVLSFWTHAMAAAAFASLLLWRLRTGVSDRSQAMLLAAYLLTAAWAWLAAIGGPASPLAVLAETFRNLVWIALLYGLAAPERIEEAPAGGVRLVLGAEALVIGCQLVLNILTIAATVPADVAQAFDQTSRLLRVVMAAGALIIVHNVYAQAAPSSRGPIRLAMFALALSWGYDLNLYTFAYLGAPLADSLLTWRGLLVAATMPLFALSRGQEKGWRIRLSRTAAFQSLSLLAICAYFAVMAILATALKGTGWDSIVEIPAMKTGSKVPGSVRQSKLLDELTTSVAGGRALQTSLLSVLLLDDGRILVGAVPMASLEAAAQ